MGALNNSKLNKANKCLCNIPPNSTKHVFLKIILNVRSKEEVEYTRKIGYKGKIVKMIAYGDVMF